MKGPRTKLQHQVSSEELALDRLCLLIVLCCAAVVMLLA